MTTTMAPVREVERRAVRQPLSVAAGAAGPVIRGYAALFNSPSQPIGGKFIEVIAPGAFAKTLREGDIRALWNHNPDYVLGRTKSGTLRLWTDEKGLWMEVQPPDAEWARGVVASIERGDVDGQSFGFQAVKDDWEYPPGELPVRTLREVRLYDVSPVTFPAYTQTTVSTRALSMAGKAEEARRRADHARRLEELERLKNAVPDGLPQLLKRRVWRYSLSRAVLDPSGPERDVSRELCRRYELVPHGDQKRESILVPWLALERRDITVGTEGPDLVGVDMQAPVEFLRPASVVVGAGATLVDGLRGTARLPRATADMTAQWVAEGGSPAESSPTFDSVALTPRTLTGYVDISRQALLQASPGFDAFLRSELQSAVAAGIDKAALHGAGGNEPTGIINTSGVGLVSIGANGGPPTWSHIVQLEEKVAIANAPAARLAYITNPKVRSKLRRTEGFTGAGPVWAVDRVAGHPGFVTTNVASDLTKGTGSNLSAIFFGDWSELLVGSWGPGVELLVDGVTLAPSGLTRLLVFASVDVGVRHAGSFAVIKDADTT